MMNLTEMWNLAEQIEQGNEDEYTFIGVRFENKERQLGEICECSKHNPDRADDRDFPNFGTDKYDEMIEFDGTSAWKINKSTKRVGLDDCTKKYTEQHAYVIAGNYNSNADDADDDEIIIEEAKVIAILF